MKYSYKPTGVCSTRINLDVENGVIIDANFERGCAGNAAGICSLVKGMKAEDAIEKLKGIRCGSNATSCPDQLARALEKGLGQ